MKWLEDNNFDFISRDITIDNPTKKELMSWYELSNQDIKKFFNTSGILYREMKLKDKIDSMSLEEKIDILSSNGMLVKRPLLITDNSVLIGFKEQEWKKLL